MMVCFISVNNFDCFYIVSHRETAWVYQSNDAARRDVIDTFAIHQHLEFVITAHLSLGLTCESCAAQLITIQIMSADHHSPANLGRMLIRVNILSYIIFGISLFIYGSIVYMVLIMNISTVQCTELVYRPSAIS